MLQSPGSQRVRHDLETEQQQLVAQWQRIHLPMQETWVQSLVWEGTKPICGCLVTQLCPTHCKCMDCSMLGFPVLHYLLEFAQTMMPPNHHILCHPLLLPSTFPVSDFFQWVGSLHQVAKVLDLQLQHQSFQ